MILYELSCSSGHQFEAWFKSSTSFDEQNASGAVECPHCGDQQINKAPMAPNLGKGANKNEPSEVRAREVAKQILKAVEKLRENVEKTCDDVGDEFAEEARRIHYGEAEEHGIYGEATEDEANELDEEGIKFSRIPLPSRRDD